MKYQQAILMMIMMKIGFSSKTRKRFLTLKKAVSTYVFEETKIITGYLSNEIPYGLSNHVIKL